MAGIFCTDYFEKQAEMTLSSELSDEEIAYRLQMLYLPGDALPQIVGPRLSQHNYASSSSSSVRKCEARYSGMDSVYRRRQCSQFGRWSLVSFLFWL